MSLNKIITALENGAKITIDSRQITNGDIFLCLKGERTDGHNFIDIAFKAGANFIIGEKKLSRSPNYILVNNSLTTLTEIAKIRRTNSKAKFIAITGSVGKTSFKEMLKYITNGYATFGNFNNHIGVPLTLANLKKDTKIAIIEMGMSAAGEISTLTKLTNPDIAIITAITLAHSEFFKNEQAIANSKLEICEGLNDGVIILPKNNSHYNYMKNKINNINNIKSFGEIGADFQLLNYSPNIKGAEIIANIFGKIIRYNIGTHGKHFAILSTAALGISALLGRDIQKDANKLINFHEPEGRGRIHYLNINGKNIYLIDDSYNANPLSMQSALQKLEEFHKITGGRKIAILGDMLELGNNAINLHKNINIATIDKLYLTGNLMQNLYNICSDNQKGDWGKTADDLFNKIKILDGDILDGDIILIKGSHGSNVFTIADKLKELTK